MTLPGCGCDCCGVSGPILPSEAIPDGTSLVAFLNSNRNFVSGYSASPQRWSGSGFVTTLNLFGQQNPPSGGTVHVYANPDVLRFQFFQAGLLGDGEKVSVTLPNGLIISQPNIAPLSINISRLPDGSELVVKRQGSLSEDRNQPPADFSNDLECLVVVERDGIVVSSRVRPTQLQLDADTQQDGTYLIHRYFDPQYDSPRQSFERMPQSRPTHFITTLTVDNSPRKAGLLPWNDTYQGHGPAPPLVLFETKPRPGFDPFEGLSDLGDRTRPAYFYTPLLQQTGTALSGVQTFTVSLFPGPPVYPATTFRTHPVPGGNPANFGPQPRFRHPGLETREQFRTRLQTEKVGFVLLDFSEPVDISGVNGGQAVFVVDGEIVSGVNVSPVGDTGRTFSVSVPLEPQVEGAFCLLTYDPAGEVFPENGASRPSVLATRTSWLMHKPYKRQRTLTRKDVAIDQQSVSHLVANPEQLENFSISLANNVAFFSSEIGTIAQRRSDEFFSPGMPDSEGEPANSSYWGLNTTIHPAPPTWLDCPNAGSIERRDSAFFVRDVTQITLEVMDGFLLQGYGEMTLTNSGNQGNQNQYRFSQAGTLYQTVSETQFATYKAVTTRTLTRITANIDAIRRVTQYTELKTSYAWELALFYRVEYEHSVNVAHIANDPLVPAPPPPQPQTIVLNDIGQVSVSPSEEQARDVEKRAAGLSAPWLIRMTF